MLPCCQCLVRIIIGHLAEPPLWKHHFANLYIVHCTGALLALSESGLASSSSKRLARECCRPLTVCARLHSTADAYAGFCLFNMQYAECNMIKLQCISRKVTTVCSLLLVISPTSCVQMSKSVYARIHNAHMSCILLFVYRWPA